MKTRSFAFSRAVVVIAAGLTLAHHAALALTKIRPGTVEAIPVLTEALKTIPPPLEAVKRL